MSERHRFLVLLCVCGLACCVRVIGTFNSICLHLFLQECQISSSRCVGSAKACVCSTSPKPRCPQRVSAALPPSRGNRRPLLAAQEQPRQITPASHVTLSASTVARRSSPVIGLLVYPNFCTCSFMSSTHLTGPLRRRRMADCSPSVLTCPAIHLVLVGAQ